MKKTILKILSLYGEPHCDNLSHSKKEQHGAGEECPVVKKINELKKEIYEKP